MTRWSSSQKAIFFQTVQCAKILIAGNKYGFSGKRTIFFKIADYCNELIFEEIQFK